jgi:hypothetical protein
MIQEPVPAEPPSPPPPPDLLPPQSDPPVPSKMLFSMRLNPRNPDDVSGFLASVRQALSRQDGGPITVALVREEGGA